MPDCRSCWVSRSTTTRTAWTTWPTCWHGYPFDVLLGSVHWLGTWRFDVLSDPQVLAEWDHRDIDAVWEEYTRAMEELGASGVCDVFAHPDLVKIAGRRPAVPDEFYDRITEAAVASGMAAEVSSAGWRKPVGEEYPAPPLLRRFVDQGVPLTTASDAHTLPDVAERADDLRTLLTDAGVSSLRGFRKRQPHEIAVGPVPAPTVAGPTGAPAPVQPTRGRADRWPPPPNWPSSAPTWSRSSWPTSNACSAPGASSPTCRSPTWC